MPTRRSSRRTTRSRRFNFPLPSPYVSPSTRRPSHSSTDADLRRSTSLRSQPRSLPARAVDPRARGRRAATSRSSTYRWSPLKRTSCRATSSSPSATCPSNRLPTTSSRRSSSRRPTGPRWTWDCTARPARSPRPLSASFTSRTSRSPSRARSWVFRDSTRARRPSRSSTSRVDSRRTCRSTVRSPPVSGSS